MVATDDTVFMNRIPRNECKDSTLTEQITALGCDISSRPRLAEPAKPKLITCISALLDVLHRRVASPKALLGLLGLLQWLCLLQRPVFGAFDKICQFVDQEPGKRRAQIPVNVLKELAVALGLLPLLRVRLDKKHANDFLGCDATMLRQVLVSASQRNIVPKTRCRDWVT